MFTVLELVSYGLNEKYDTTVFASSQFYQVLKKQNNSFTK